MIGDDLVEPDYLEELLYVWSKGTDVKGCGSPSRVPAKGAEERVDPQC